jgi:hypothetical protein
MANQIQFRRDTSANWSSVNPILAQGEIGVNISSTPFTFKFGNGVDNWNTLPYQSTGGSGGSVAWGAITGTLSNQGDLQIALNAKQNTLVSGTNIKTVNGTSILGTGNLSIGINNLSDVFPQAITGYGALVYDDGISKWKYIPNKYVEVDTATVVNGSFTVYNTSYDRPTITGSLLYNLTYGIEVAADQFINSPSVIFGISSVTQGFVKPRMTTAQRNAIASPVKGLEVFDTTLNLPYYYNGTSWVSVNNTTSWGSITGTLSNQTDLQNALNAKQATLVSGTNIKTVNGNSLLGSGDITISASSGLTSLNALTASTQIFATSTTGTDFTITSATSTHTFNLPTASASVRGLLSSANWTTFNNKLSYTGATADLNLGVYNLITNNVFTGFTSVAASGTLITLTISSTPYYNVTGSGGQIIKLPDATTLQNGATFVFNNNQSSGAITVNNNSNTLIASIPSGGYVTVTLLSNSIAAGSWDRHFEAPANVSWSTNTFDYNGSITSATWNGVAITDTYISSASTWNSKQAALNGTGFVKISGTTISYDNSTYLTSITSANVTTALGFTPYNATNPNGYITSSGTAANVSGTVAIANGGTGATSASAALTALGAYAASNPSGYISANQTITLSGDVTGSGTTAITSTLATVSQASSGNFVKVTLDTKGRVTGNTAVTAADITNLGFVATITTNRQIASYTLVIGDYGKLVEMNVATANTLTVPTNASVAFPIGTQILISQYGAGACTVTAASGVTLRSESSKLKTNGQYSGATLVKIATDEWYVFGNLTA